MSVAELAAAGAWALLASGPMLAFDDQTALPAPTETGEPLKTLREVAPALAKCWSPPSLDGVGEITVMISFRRDGSIIGQPRISYSRAVDPAEQRELKDSLLSALARCGPLPVSPSLGAAIAGRMFAIRFIVTNQKGQNI